MPNISPHKWVPAIIGMKLSWHEPTTAIIVACLASYRALFTQSDRVRKLPDFERKNPNFINTSVKGLLASKKSTKSSGIKSMTGAPTEYNVRTTGHDWSDHSGHNGREGESESVEYILPLTAVHVQNDITHIYSARECDGWHVETAN